MPIHPQLTASAFKHPQYFTTLQELDAYNAQAHHPPASILPYITRSGAAVKSAEGRGKLLVSHDYKGGYTELPTARCYTFNFWSSVDTFIYFSHHRITIPPSSWTIAAHRQGVKMLGVLIFEGGAESDCLRLLLGRTSATAKPTRSSNPELSIPLSNYYAKALAKLAADRGFDGWLLNFECPLAGGVEQTHLTSVWIDVLRAEVKSAVGDHGQVIWYDSVVITGQLAWQDRLNYWNLPFYLSSDSMFTNYTWPITYPALTKKYLSSIPSSLRRDKSPSSIWVGVDVWGRGSHGGGGYGSYKAIEHVAEAEEKGEGLSVALFGQAWTWESEQDKEGWDWESWWSYEKGLWVGPAGSEPPPPPPQIATQQQDNPRGPRCEHGPYRPISSFFPTLPPPNPSLLPFFTSFSPGTGVSWFVNGQKVMQSEGKGGWTDIEKQGSVGDLVWPRPKVTWAEEGEAGGYIEEGEEKPVVRSALEMGDAWLGGSSLRISLDVLPRPHPPSPTENEDEELFRCVRVPINSLALTPGTTYDASMTYKIISNESEYVDLGLCIQLDEGDVEVVSDGNDEDQVSASGWTKTRIRFTTPSSSSSSATTATATAVVGAAAQPAAPADADIPASISLQISYTYTPSRGTSLSLLLGLLSVSQSIQPLPLTPSRGKELRWETGVTFAPLDLHGGIGAGRDPEENPIPAWVLDSGKTAYPGFAYFNIYAEAQLPSLRFEGAESAIFIGTSGVDGERDSFGIGEREIETILRLNKSEDGGQRVVRFWVQGVTDRGEVLDWADCASVDAAI
ncbi:hypothetical protein SISSUDRAFT_1008983, partial [Sistotremastrum suecicum HHB10207 ss-3]